MWAWQPLEVSEFSEGDRKSQKDTGGADACSGFLDREIFSGEDRSVGGGGKRSCRQEVSGGQWKKRKKTFRISSARETDTERKTE